MPHFFKNYCLEWEKILEISRVTDFQRLVDKIFEHYVADKLQKVRYGDNFALLVFLFYDRSNEA